MTNQSLRTLTYALAWFLVTLFCLRGGHGELIDQVVTAGGLSLAHGACARLIIASQGRLRFALLGIYVLLSAPLLSALLLHCVFIKSGGVLDADAVRAIAQTNGQEMLAYIQNLIAPLDAIAAASITILLVAGFPRRQNSLRFLPAVAISVVAVAGVSLANAGSLTILMPMKLTITQYRQEMSEFRAVLTQRKIKQISGAASSFDGTAIVIIGESTSRRHMSRYGYFRTTTPLMDKRGDSVIAFTDVISAHSHTVPALATALISSGATHAADFFTAESIDIVSLAKSAGFRTSWLSNQNEFGIWDNPVTVIAKETDQSQFLSSGVGRTFRRSHLDHELLPLLRAKIEKPESKRNLIFLHLFSSHAPYCFNYPEDLAYFNATLGQKFFGNATEPADVNCYDNGMRYIDEILDSAIRIADKSLQPVVLTYFSDHGEAPLLATAHESSKHSSYHIEIPVLLWANDAYAKSHGEVLSAARSNIDRPYSSGRLYHSLAQLLEITHTSVDERHSLFSNVLVDLPRSSIGGVIRYDQWSSTNDYRENASVNVRSLGELRKSVWAHRVDSLGKLLEAAPIFGGIEMDVVFADSQQCFHVYHPPAPDISLNLTEMLAAANYRPDLKFWIDWKNATAQNMGAAIKCLDDLDARFNIRSRALVETGSDAVFPETRDLAKAGYTHGYYLPTEAVLECLKKCDEAGTRKLALQIQRTVEDGGYSAITFDWRLRSFVAGRLRDWIESRSLTMYSWDMSINAAGATDAKAHILQRFSELDLAALLVTFPSHFGI